MTCIDWMWVRGVGLGVWKLGWYGLRVEGVGLLWIQGSESRLGYDSGLIK